MFGGVLPLLAEGRQVIAVDLQAHGRTADIDRPLSFESMADDIGALIDHLGFENADVMDYSLGGGVALRAAIQHPEVVKKLVVVSTPFKRDGWYPEVLAGMGQMGPEAAEPMKQTPMYQLYANIVPKPEDWPVLLIKLGQLLGQDYDWSEDVAAMETLTLIVGRGRRQRPHRTCCAVLRTARRRQGRRRMGWIRNVQCPARHPACHDALRYLLLTHAGVHRHAVPRRDHARSRVTAASTRSESKEKSS